MSKLDVARILYGTQTESGPSVGKPVASTSVRYGTVVSVNEDGTITVTLEDTGETVTLRTDTPVSVGDRVSIVVSNGSYIVYSLAETGRQIGTVRKDLSQQIKDEGDRILGEVNGEMDAWKADHQLTDADITSSIEKSKSEITATFDGKLESLEDDVKTTYATKTYVSAGIDGLRTEVSEKYATTEGVSNEISSAIEQSSSKISQTVEQNVMNAVGETYATKTQLTQTSDEIRGIANGAVSTANSASGTASSALEKAEEVEAYFTFDVTGLKVGQSAIPSAVKMSSGGSFDVLYNSVSILSLYSKSSAAYIESAYYADLYLINQGSAVLGIGDSGFTFSSHYAGFSINGLRAVESAGFVPSDSTSSFDRELSGMSGVSEPQSIWAVVIYWRCTYNDVRGCSRLQIEKGQTRKVELRAMQENAAGGNNVIGCSEVVEVTLSDAEISVARGLPCRFAIGSTSSFNGSTGSQFSIEYISFCA